MVTHTHVAYGDETTAPPCVDLGHGVCIRPWHQDGDKIVDFFIAHERTVPFDAAKHVEERCVGRIPVRPAGSAHPADHASWEMTGSLQAGDLTLTPSILCRDPDGICGGSHGFIRNSAWVPA